MAFKRNLTAFALFTLLSTGFAYAENCAQKNTFSGLIFDAGAFPSPQNMENHLDKALSYGVEKVVLFPHASAQPGNKPDELEEIFPDLVVQGEAPWNDGEAIVWAEEIVKSGLDALGAELEANPMQAFLLPNPLRYDLKTVLNMQKQYENLWIGFGVDEIEALLKTCAKGDVARLMDVSDGKVVFASYGQFQGWKSYKWTIRKLKKLASVLPKQKADAFIFGNAEELYNLAVNAP